MTSTSLTICYFGIFDPHFSRNAVYIRGLRENGVEVIICSDQAPGFLKYKNILKSFWKDRKKFDAVIVGYSGHVIVPLAKFMSLVSIRKPVIFDALCSFYEGNILSRDAFKNIPFRKLWCRLVDIVANISADYILLETEAQRHYYVHTLKVSSRKCIVALTGVDDDLFYYDPSIKKLEKFTVLFRGKFTPEAGIQHILEAARLLERGNINVRIIGFGWGEVGESIKKQVENMNLQNLEFINHFLPIEQLREKILECSVSLGQFEKHERLTRTIPHKAFEAMAMKMPYITARAEPVGEVFKNGESCLFVEPRDPQDLVNKILILKNDTELRTELAQNAFDLYSSSYTPRRLAESLLQKIVPFFKP